MGKVYRGVRLKPADTTLSDVMILVTKEDGVTYTLEPEDSQKIYNHSPTGFSWGYGGSGPAQLALAILFDYLGDQSKAVQFYQRFKSLVVSNWGTEWILYSEELDALVKGFTKDDA